MSGAVDPLAQWQASARAVLFERPRACWSLSVYPQAAEAGGRWVTLSRPHRSGGVPDPVRSAEEAARRARGQVRRYCAANRLNRLGTVTYRGDGCHDTGKLRQDVAGFFRRLRKAQGGQRFPYLWVGEWHPGGHGLHVHFAVGMFIARSRIEQSWGHGFVHIKLLGDLPVGSTSLHEARHAARYLAKYVGKSADDVPPGLHRYEVAQGFQPAKITLEADTLEAVLADASDRFTRPPAHVWRSSDAEQWHAPPAVWASWD